MSKARPARPDLREAIGGLWWCVFGGALTFLAYPWRAVPESGLWPLAWVSLVPLLWALRDASPRRAFWSGWLFGLVTNMGGFWWISGVLIDFGHLPGWLAWPITVLNAAYQGLQAALFAWLLVTLRRRDGDLPGIAVTAAAFTAVEAVFPLIFPWYLGNSQHRFLHVVQVADLVGVTGVTLTLVVFNALAFRVVRAAAGDARLRRVPAGAALVFVGAVLVYGAVRIPQVDALAAAAPKRAVGMVEANIGIWEKEAEGLNPQRQALTLHANLLTHQALSRDLATRGADLLVWPESSYFPLGDVFGKRLDDFAAGVGPSGRLALWRDRGAGGAGWTVGPALPMEPGAARALAAEREDALLVAGEHGQVAFWNGREATAVPLSSGAGAAPPTLLAAAVTVARGFDPAEDGAPLRLWVAGQHGALATGSPEAGLDLVPSGTDRTLRALAMADPKRGVAAGDEGTIVAVGPDGGRVLDSPTSRDLHAAWAEPGTLRFWLAGEGGTVVRGEEGALHLEETPTDATLRALAGPGRSGLWAVGARGTVLRREAGGWTREPLDTAEDLVAVAVAARGEVLVSGAQGGQWLRDDTGWRRLDAPGLGPLRALAPLPWVKMFPIPRDARHLYQSPLPVPSRDAFFADYARELRHPRADLGAVQRGFTVPVLFGAVTWEREVAGDRDSRRVLYNSALMLDGRGRIVGRYDKVYLLVFGEYIPLGETFPVFYDWIPASGRFSPGHDVAVFEWDGIRAGVLVCYEDILPRFAADVLAQGPNLLVNVTNDAWFGRTSEPYLHLALATLRSVESRRALVRSTNTGVSAIIDPVGRLVRQTDLDTAETVLADVPLMEAETLYATVGDLLALALLAWIVSLLGVRLLTRGRTRPPRRRQAR